MRPIQLESQVGPDGVLQLAVPIGTSEANRRVMITIEQSSRDFEQQTSAAGQHASLYGSCVGLGLEEPPDLPLPPLRVE